MIKIPVSVGELIDKVSILHVKQLTISNEEKLEYVNKEFELLYNISSYYLNNQEIENLYHQLVEINKKLWDIEDKIREKERKNEFDEEFIELSRSVYFTNDERSKIKKKINDITGSNFSEEKSYEEY